MHTKFRKRTGIDLVNKATITFYECKMFSWNLNPPLKITKSVCIINNMPYEMKEIEL